VRLLIIEHWSVPERITRDGARQVQLWPDILSMKIDRSGIFAAELGAEAGGEAGD
jgi:hypothetical protein